MSDKLHIDFETKSRIDLLKCGLDPYARHPSTKVLMMSYGMNQEPVKLWQPHLQPKAPAELRDALLDPYVEKHAWNDMFERMILEHVMRLKVPGKWRDTAKKARYLSLPGQLFMCGPIVGIDPDKQKLASGRRLINLFCKPRTDKQRVKDDREFNDWNSHPEEFNDFGTYCVIDTEAERAIGEKFEAYPMPDHEWAIAELNNVINSRGLPIDLDFVRNALQMADRAKTQLLKELREVCGMSNVTGVAVFKAWAKERGYPFNDLRKDTIKRALADFENEMSPECKRALVLRRDAMATATAKYKTLLEAQHGGVLRQGFVFYGAQRTGRFSGAKFQPHNLKKPDKTLEKKLAHITQLVRDDDYDSIDFEFSYPLRVLGSVVRSAIRARPGKILRVSDLNAIENRVLGWLANCKRTLSVFENELDPYKAFGVHLYQTEYDSLTKLQRDNSKPAVLGAGYRLGGGTLAKNKAGDIVKTGLWGYAESMGIKLTKEESWQAVAVYREIHPAVVKYWYDLEWAAQRAIVQKIPTRVGHVVFDYVKGFLRMRLPSGRHLYYLRPFYRKVKFMGPEGPYYKDSLHYEGVNQITKQWGLLTTHGGKLCENACQAVARDVIVHGLEGAEELGFYTIGHVHDEIITEEDIDDTYHTPLLLSQTMSRVPSWGKGLPLAAVGYQSDFYKKD